MSASIGPELTGQAALQQDLTGLFEVRLDDVVGEISLFDPGLPRGDTCGKKHDLADWSVYNR